MLSKHRAPIRAWLLAVTTLGRILVSWTVKPKWRDKKAHRDAIWQGLNDFMFQRLGMRRSD
jgi:hypothetical protein